MKATLLIAALFSVLMGRVLFMAGKMTWRSSSDSRRMMKTRFKPQMNRDAHG
jgi:hypothetical protein